MTDPILILGPGGDYRRAIEVSKRFFPLRAASIVPAFGVAFSKQSTGRLGVARMVRAARGLCDRKVKR